MFQENQISKHISIDPKSYITSLYEETDYERWQENVETKHLRARQLTRHQRNRRRTEKQGG